MLEDGSLTGKDLAWQEGMPAWVPVSQLFMATAQATPPLPITAPPLPSIATSQPHPASVALWNPNTAVNFSLLFSPVFGAALHYMNWRALGQIKEASISLRWCVASIVLLGVAFAVPESATDVVRFVGIGLLLGWYFSHAKKQVAFVKQGFGTNYQKKSFLVPVFAGIGVLAILIGLLSLIGPPLPEVDSPEVVALAEQALQESPALKLTGEIVGKVKITNPGEVSYDSKKPRRVARAELTTKLGKGVIYYSVEWHNKSKGIIWVQIQEQP